MLINPHFDGVAMYFNTEFLKEPSELLREDVVAWVAQHERVPISDRR